MRPLTARFGCTQVMAQQRLTVPAGETILWRPVPGTIETNDRLQYVAVATTRPIVLTAVVAADDVVPDVDSTPLGAALDVDSLYFSSERMWSVNKYPAYTIANSGDQDAIVTVAAGRSSAASVEAAPIQVEATALAIPAGDGAEVTLEVKVLSAPGRYGPIEPTQFRASVRLFGPCQWWGGVPNRGDLFLGLPENNALYRSVIAFRQEASSAPNTTSTPYYAASVFTGQSLGVWSGGTDAMGDSLLFTDGSPSVSDAAVGAAWWMVQGELVADYGQWPGGDADDERTVP